MEHEYEIIRHTALRHISIFVNDIRYRNVHFHRELELILILDGSGSVRIGEEVCPAGADALFLVNSNESHSFDSPDGHLLCLIVQISSGFLRDVVPELRELTFRSGRVPDADGGLRARIRETALVFLGQGDLYGLRTVAGVADILVRLADTLPHGILPETPKSADRLARMRTWADYIDEHAETGVTLEDLGKAEGLSPTYLSHLFRSYFGIRFQEYLSNVRFEKALALASNPDLSVYDLALASGFSDPKYLNERFRKQFGCTVKQYRRQQDAALRGSIPHSPASAESRYTREEALALLSN